jgi:N-formylglutamate deformylase
MRFSRAPVRSLAYDADLYVDELFSDAPTAGATLLTAHASRYFVDLNVAPAPPSPAVLGIPERQLRRSESGDRWREERPPPEERERRLALVFQPYHATIETILHRKRERFGIALLLSAHSYAPSHAPAGAEVIVGTGGQGTRSAWAREIAAVAREHGRAVGYDEPFRGGYALARHGAAEEGIHAVQLELRRSTYMNTATLEPDTEGFAATRAFASTLVRRLVVLTRQASGLAR